jgi:tetratricopeptide (TPR) repeat protein
MVERRSRRDPGKPKAKRTQQHASARSPRPGSTRTARRSRGPAPGAVRDEFLRLGGARGPKLYDQLVRAADAYAADRERDALRILRPLREALPQVASVRELAGLALYRSGRYAAAAEELEEYVALCGAVDQHPALMDCYRALRKWKRVDALWAELSKTSAAAPIMTEGRIVLAGSLADRGRVREAIRVLERRAGDVRKVEEHHLRLWYALGDLQERAGNLPRARALFERISRHDPGFADVAERLSALG